MSQHKPLLIAEAKVVSPFGYSSSDSLFQRTELAIRSGDWISVHVEQPWGGSREHIYDAKQLMRKLGLERTILAKGIHAADEEIRESLVAGADYALVVGRVPDSFLLKYCLVEPYDLANLREMLPHLTSQTRLVWNARDLRNRGLPKAETWEQARELWPAPRWLCQASYITSCADVKSDANAIIVGEKLPQYVFSTASK